MPDRPRSAAWLRRWWIVPLVACLIALGVFVAEAQSRSKKRAVRPPPPGVPVTAVAAATAEVGVYLTGLGAVTPLNTVTVRTRVDGQLMEVRFREGQIVARADLLAQIDPRPFQAQLTQFEGQLGRDQALLRNAELDRERYRLLWTKDAVPKQQLDTQEALVRQYQGTVLSDQGQIDSARLNLTYCRITAPIGGRIGLRLVDPGNIVHAADATGLIVITQVQPIAVVFTLPEDQLPQVLALLRVGAPLGVEAWDRDRSHRLAVGSLLTVDNQIDPTTGTVRLKAIFPNLSDELFPGQFVNARLLAATLHGAVVVPAVALQRGPKGPFLYVVKPGGVAGVRPVVVAELQEGQAALRSGVAANELVVIEGAERLHDGSRLVVTAPPAPASAPASAPGAP